LSLLERRQSGQNFPKIMEIGELRFPREGVAALDEIAASSENTFRPHS
jgi:hypothetical protein